MIKEYEFFSDSKINGSSPASIHCFSKFLGYIGRKKKDDQVVELLKEVTENEDFFEYRGFYSLNSPSILALLTITEKDTVMYSSVTLFGKGEDIGKLESDLGMFNFDNN